MTGCSSFFIVVAVDNIACRQPVLFHNVPWDLMDGARESTLDGGITVVDERELGIRMNEGGR